jgi:hypothetical protein
VDGKSVAKKTMENSTPIEFPEDEDFDVGLDRRTGIAMIEYRYDCPFKFTGRSTSFGSTWVHPSTPRRIASKCRQLRIESRERKTGAR